MIPVHPAQWWERISEERLRCTLCPRLCVFQEGERGYCGVRMAHEGALFTAVYGGTCGLAMDPIEKKPLYHFLPGSMALSFGMGGCNLDCAFCQNWHISATEAEDLRLSPASPQGLADLARHHQAASVAFTYNEPIISAEWCIDVAAACRATGIQTVAVTNGYVKEGAREAFFEAMDAVNVDLKAFSERFYRKLTGAHLAPVLETLEYLAAKDTCWLEVTTLLIPGENDDHAEIAALSEWVLTHLGPQVPLHFTAFHPDYHMTDHPRTPLETLQKARAIAMEVGLSFPYIGNAHDPEGNQTFCPGCRTPLIQRKGFGSIHIHLDRGRCPGCGVPVAGVWPQEFST